MQFNAANLTRTT